MSVLEHRLINQEGVARRAGIWLIVCFFPESALRAKILRSTALDVCREKTRRVYKIDPGSVSRHIWGGRLATQQIISYENSGENCIMSEISRPILRDVTNPALLPLGQISGFLVKGFMFFSKKKNTHGEVSLVESKSHK